MTMITSTVSSLFHLPQTLQNAANSIKQIDRSTINHAIDFAKAEVTEMSKSFALGTTFGWLNGIRNPYSTGTLFALSNSAAKRIYPTLHTQFRCRTDTKIRNIFVNFLADVATTAVANYAAHQIGFNINLEGIIIMKVGSVLIPTLLKAANTPLNKIPELLPEIATTAGLSVLLGRAVRQMGYELDLEYLAKQQVSNVAMILLINKCFATAEYFILKSFDETTVPPPHENRSPKETPLNGQEFTLTETQKKLLEKTQSEVITSLGKSCALTYLFFKMMGTMESISLRPFIPSVI